MSYEVRFVPPKPKKGARGRYMVGDKPLESFVLREIDGTDEEYALGRAKAIEGNMAEELIRVAIVAVNDAPVSQPYVEMGRWNSRARGLLSAAWKELNSVTEAEEADFLSAAVAPGDEDPPEK